MMLMPELFANDKNCMTARPENGIQNCIGDHLF